MRLTLIRHGQTPSNVAGLLDTAPPGPGLTDLGREQAAAIPAALGGAPVDAIFASNQLRAQQTATPLAEARRLDMQVLDGLREIAAGELEMAGDADSVHRYIGTLVTWLEGDLRTRIPGGPNGFEVVDRMDAAVTDIAAEVGSAGTAVAVSHGALIRVWSALRTGEAEHGARHLPNTGAVTLEGAPGASWRVLSWGEGPIGAVPMSGPMSQPTSGPMSE